MFVLTGRFGPYVQLGEQEEGTKKKPKRASLFASMTPETVTLDEALQLLSAAARRRHRLRRPRDRRVARPVRSVPEALRRRHAQPHRRGAAASRSRCAEAEALYAQPKMRRGRQQKPPLAELGENPDNGQPVRVLEGRYGAYVTDGNVNATVPRGTDPAALTLDEAVGLLRARAEAGAGEEGQEGRQEGGEEDREEGGEEGREEGGQERRPRRRRRRRRTRPAKRRPEPDSSQE